MDRRKFLQGLAIAAAGVAIAPAITAPIGLHKQVDPLPVSKYKNCLEMLDACIATKEDAQSCNFCADALLSYMMDNFPVPVNNHATVVQMNMMLSASYTEEEVRSIPPVVAEELYPVFMMKTIRAYDLPLDYRMATAFMRFRTRYGDLILKSTEVKKIT